MISTAMNQATLRNMLSKESEDFCDLVMGLLEYDPSKRLTAAQALTHPFLFPTSFDPYLRL